MIKRTIVVGDVHGCLPELKMLLDKVNFQQDEDRLILAGDLVDRGPDSVGVVRYAMAIGAEAVAGNHDDKLLRRRKHVMRAQRDKNYKIPMRPDQEQEGIIAALTQREGEWLAGLPTYIELPDFNALVLHAGVVPGKHVSYQSREVLTMMRYMDKDDYRMMRLEMPGFRQPKDSVFWAELYDGDVDIIFGHNVVGREDPQIWENALGAKCYGIDTGCCFGGRLTACILRPEDPFAREIMQVQALAEYKKYGGYTEE